MLQRILLSFAVLVLPSMITADDDLGALPRGAGHVYGGIQAVKTAACGMEQPSNKFDGAGYELMYGLFMWPLRRLQKMKMLEIGLGCNMGYGPGASARTWREVLPNAELWEAEFDHECVDKNRQRLDALGIHALVGDQGNRTTLHRWVSESGGNFNAIIDDGSHRNGDIMASFEVLWPTLVPGGVYFLEDLNVGRPKRWDDTNGNQVVSDILQSWNDQFLVHPFEALPQHPSPANLHAAQTRKKFQKPPNVAFVFCQDAACVVGKEVERRPNRIGRDGAKCPKGGRVTGKGATWVSGAKRPGRGSEVRAGERKKKSAILSSVKVRSTNV